MMKKSTRIWNITASCLLGVGVIVMLAVLSACSWDFKKLSTSEFQVKTYTIEEEFTSIALDVDTTDISILPSEDGACKVVCGEREKEEHRVAVENAVLTITFEDTRKWYEMVGFNFRKSSITVYLPQTEYDTLSVTTSTGDVAVAKEFTFNTVSIVGSTCDVKMSASVVDAAAVKVTTGDILWKNASVGSLDVTVSTGDITLSSIDCEGDIKIGVSTGESDVNNVICKNLISTGTTGDIELTKVVAKERFSITRSTGDVEFEDCDAAEIFVETSTGDVEGSLLSDKVFIITTDTGKKRVPDTVTGGRCEITTDTGDIIITIAK